MYYNNIMLDGRGSYDLVANNIIGKEIAEKYINGDRTLFNDFAAAKDAWDLEHPEAWYVDSSYLSLRTTRDSNNYHVYIGPGRSNNYYVRGVKNSDDVIMYDINADGSMDCFEDWYYSAHMLHAMGEEGYFTAGDNLIGVGDKFYTDTENCLVMNVSNCEYVEFAVTTKGTYEQIPYVKNASPGFNSSISDILLW